MSKKKFRKSTNSIISGVCGGIAEYLNLDPTLVRALYAILTVCTAFSGVLVYFILMILMPRATYVN